MIYYPWNNRCEIEVLKGLILNDVVQIGEECIRFVAADGRIFNMCHSQDCCESVTIESIVGDLMNLVGEPILMAEEVTHEGTNPQGVTIPEWQESFTWTFYKFATHKGYVDIRWYGESNGYYSERVDFYEVKE